MVPSGLAHTAHGVLLRVGGGHRLPTTATPARGSGQPGRVHPGVARGVHGECNRAADMWTLEGAVTCATTLRIGIAIQSDDEPRWGDGCDERSGHQQSHAHPCIVGLSGDGPLCQHIFWGIPHQFADAIGAVILSTG